MPIIPVAIDLSTRREVTSRPTAINARAPSRSDHGARLKNSHQTMIASAPATPTIIPRRKALGTSNGMR